ncbi:MAG TPA: malto-oligosyltrehalose synthase [Acetobacteraceae bacterium]|nr:malto-oligosyltrehalose synthase [Acetobacteraceae bacterium]
MNTAPPPRATARLQFHPGFTLAHGAAVVPYLAALGISHLYASPLFAARRGSPHGYDVVDYGAINPELGGRPALERLAAALRAHGMGLVIDIVPNHMAADAVENPWWRDVLAHGRASPYSGFFDIDWSPPEPWLRGNVLMPVLALPYADALAAGGPLGLAEAEHARLAWWRTAGDAINWRRFFDINVLVALRAERAEVFAATHALVLELFAVGLIDGVRVDHVDGLADPAAYCRRLRRALTRAGGGRRPYIVVEKILAAEEVLPPSWGVDGTTGYDFMAEAAGLLHDPTGEEPLSRLWARLSGRAASFAAEERRARAELLSRLFSADLTRAVRALAAAGPRRDLPPAALGRAVSALARNFPVYRSYPSGPLGPLAQALAAATQSIARADRPWLHSLGEILTAPARGRHRRAQIRFQLLTAPLAAKAVEDTALYRYGRLLSHNEVGASPAQFALAPKAFHQAVIARQRRFPHTMLATATHDHKRGEDVRARLAVLSELPAEWAARVEGWMERNSARRRILRDGPAPGPGEELMLYQTLVGAWPLLLDPADEAGVAVFAARVARWQEKALREAKERTDWAEPDEAYERACRDFLSGMLADSTLRAELAGFAARIAPAGAVNGLAQTMLHLTVPGVPDLYQGAEFWDESLVDPDNRRAVDYAAREQALARAAPLAGLLREWRSGHVKQALIARLLAMHARLPRLFAAAAYLPLAVSGPRASHVLAFARKDGPACLLIAVARLVVPLLRSAQAPVIDSAVWAGTVLHAPALGPWQNALTCTDRLSGESLALAAVFAGLPIACWLVDEGSR